MPPILLATLAVEDRRVLNRWNGSAREDSCCDGWDCRNGGAELTEARLSIDFRGLGAVISEVGHMPKPRHPPSSCRRMVQQPFTDALARWLPIQS